MNRVNILDAFRICNIWSATFYDINGEEKSSLGGNTGVDIDEDITRDDFIDNVLVELQKRELKTCSGWVTDPSRRSSFFEEWYRVSIDFNSQEQFEVTKDDLSTSRLDDIKETARQEIYGP